MLGCSFFVVVVVSGVSLQIFFSDCIMTQNARSFGLQLQGGRAPPPL